MIKEVTPLGTIDYTYDAIGRRTSMTVAGQPTVNYSYDANSRLTGMNTTINNVASGFSLSYDAIGRRTSLTLPNGVKTNYNYDDGSHLLEMKHLSPVNQLLESLNYSYDATGNRTSMNRQSVTLPLRNEVSNTNYNEANQMLRYNASSDNMAYDENGNLTSITNGCGTTNYTWDVRNRLIGISGFDPACASLTASFKYDALGRRTEKTVNSKTTQYLYDGLDIVQEIENGVVAVNYIRTLNIDEPFARIKADGTVRYYQQDALGSVIAMTDETGAVKTQYSYDPFGGVTVSGEASDNPFQYTGRENDNTGLYYYRARYYSPELQRFISEDPINLASIQLPQEISSYRSSLYLNLIQPFPMNKTFLGLISESEIRISESEIRIFSEINIQTQLLLNPLKQNLYGYVENSPMNKIDPTGLSNTCCKAGCGALGAACILACPASGPIAPICVATCIVGADICGKGCDKSFPPGDKKDKK